MNAALPGHEMDRLLLRAIAEANLQVMDDQGIYPPPGLKHVIPGYQPDAMPAADYGTIDAEFERLIGRLEAHGRRQTMVWVRIALAAGFGLGVAVSAILAYNAGVL